MLVLSFSDQPNFVRGGVIVAAFVLDIPIGVEYNKLSILAGKPVRSYHFRRLCSPSDLFLFSIERVKGRTVSYGYFTSVAMPSLLGNTVHIVVYVATVLTEFVGFSPVVKKASHALGNGCLRLASG